uniref:Ig-like domain-containing protein n=1 Tax=Pygocentrus nattereri TaxID=42514 RepID=A0A3B4DSZ6_PYGNA
RLHNQQIRHPKMVQPEHRSRLRVLGPSDPLIVKLGGSVMLPCYIQAPLPLEVLEVEWKRTDSEALVHLFQDGEGKPEAQDQAYSGRARFFTEEVERGNFSLLLTNLTTEDAGIYNCSVYSQQATGQTLVDIEFLVVTGGHAVSAYAREDVTLNCSVDSHMSPKELERVSWTKVDQDITVLVFQEGEVLTDFSHERFRDRVEFFGPEEIHKGNFSLRLKYLRMEDKGLYRCEVLSGEFSAQTTVEIHLGKQTYTFTPRGNLACPISLAACLWIVGGNPHRHWENMQTLHRKDPGRPYHPLGQTMYFK